MLIDANLVLAGFFGLKMELMACADLVGGTRSKYIFLLTLHVSINDLVPRLASAVTLARARARGAGLSRTVQQHSNLPDLGRYRTRVMRAME